MLLRSNSQQIRMLLLDEVNNLICWLQSFDDIQSDRDTETTVSLLVNKFNNLRSGLNCKALQLRDAIKFVYFLVGRPSLSTSVPDGILAFDSFQREAVERCRGMSKLFFGDPIQTVIPNPTPWSILGLLVFCSEDAK